MSQRHSTDDVINKLDEGLAGMNAVLERLKLQVLELQSVISDAKESPTEQETQ